MADERNDTDAGAAGGNLKDEAASGGEENVSFGSLMMSDFGTEGKEESEKRKAEAISSTYLLSGSQGKNEVSEILKQREGDGLVLISDEGPARTGYQQRIVEAARQARTNYLKAKEDKDQPSIIRYGTMLARLGDALLEDGLEGDPEVKELLKEEEVEELSVIIDSEVAKEAMRRLGVDPTEASVPLDSEGRRDIGSEIEQELAAPDAAPAVSGEGHAEGSEVHGHEPVEDEQIEEEVAHPPALPEGEPEEDDSIDGRRTDAPEPAAQEMTDTRRERLAWEETHELVKVSAGGLKLTPLGEEEKERIEKLDELSSGELREMAAKRREQVEITFSRKKGETREVGKWYVQFMLKLQNAGLDTEDSLAAMRVAKMELLKQADELDALAAKRYIVQVEPAEDKKEPIQPKRPEPLRRKSVSPQSAAATADEELDRWEAKVVPNPTDEEFFDKGDSGAFTLFTRRDGSIDVQRLYAEGQGTAPIATMGAKHPEVGEKAVHVMGTPGEPGKHRDRTELGMPAAVVPAAGEGAPEAGKGEGAAPHEEGAGTVKFGTQILVPGTVGEERGPAGLGVMGRKGPEGADSLSRTNIFGQFDSDPEMARIAEEGSGALNLSHIRELSGERPALPDQASRRIPTGELPAAGDLASLEGTGIFVTERGKEKLEGGQKADAGADEAAASGVPADPAGTVVVRPEEIGGAEGQKKVYAEAAFAHTRLSSLEDALKGAAEGALGKQTRNERPKEDFSVYGDIFYSVEKVYMESTGIPAGFTPNSIGALLPDAIKKAEMLARAAANVDERKRGETILVNVEEQRVARLKKFNEDFFVIPEGKDEPRKSFLAYSEWLEGKKKEYVEISNVHELLSKALAGDLRAENKYGVSPGEYNRVGMLRLCNAAIKKGTLSEEEEARVEKLREMLEPIARGEKDIFAQTIAADATYEMIVGFATKRERARTRQLEQELGKYKITVAEYEAKREVMVKILAEVLVSVRGTESSLFSNGEESGRAKEKVKQAIMALAPDDPFERGRYLRLITDAQAGKGGEAGKELLEAAEKSAATHEVYDSGVAKVHDVRALAAEFKQRQETQAEMPGTKKAPTADELRAALYGTSKPRQPQAHAVPTPKQHGPVARSIGTALTMAAGAALLAGGLWLGQHGILTLGTRAEEVQQPVAAQVETVSQESLDKLGAAVSAQEGKVAEEAPDELPAGTTDAGKDSAKKDAGVDPLIKAVREIQADEPQVSPDKYTRDKAGLNKALDDWCNQEAPGLLVTKEYLRAAYASIEKDLDGQVLPYDLEWPGLMLRMSFPRAVGIAIYSDLASSSAESDDPNVTRQLLAEKYAAYTLLAILIGERAGNPQSFQTSIKKVNGEGAELPALDNGSHLGRLENVKRGERCFFAAYHETVMVTMGEIRADLETLGWGKKELREAVSKMFGDKAERIFKLLESANYEANQKEKEGGCKAVTGGRKGSAAVEYGTGFAIPLQDKIYKAKKAREKMYQKSVDEVLGSAPKAKTNAPKHKAHKEKQPKPAASPCAGLTNNLDFLDCQMGGKLFKQQPGVDTGEKTMPKPKGKESGSVSKAPRFIRY